MPKENNLVWNKEFYNKALVDKLMKAECQIYMSKTLIEKGAGRPSLFTYLKLTHKTAFEENYLSKKRDQDEKRASNSVIKKVIRLLIKCLLWLFYNRFQSIG